MGWPVASYRDRGVEGGHRQGESPRAVRERLNVKGGWRHRAHARRNRLNGTAAEPAPSLVHLSRPQQGGERADRCAAPARTAKPLPVPAPLRGRRPVGLSPRVRADGAAPRPRMLDRDLQRLSRATQRFPGYGDPRNLQPSRRTVGSVHACAHPVGRWCGNGTGWRCSARRSGSPVPMHMSYRSTGCDRDRCATVGLTHHGITERGTVHALRSCECQRHTGHRGMTRGRCAARASGVRTGAATHRHPRQGKADHLADASNPNTVTSAWTRRRVAPTRWGWVALHAARASWCQATANGNPRPPPSYRVGVTLGVPYRTATGTPTGQRSNAPRYSKSDTPTAGVRRGGRGGSER